MTSRPPSAPPGITVGNYELLARLGEGGMGVVHLGRGRDGRRVAVKVIRPNIVADDESRSRLAREVNSLGLVRSHRIAEIVDADPWGPVPYVATRYVPGLSLHDHVVQEGPLDEDDLLWTARCLAEALVAVHAVGVVHRDVKPSNVLMEGRSPVLIDFGLARVADDSRITADGWLLGTPGYMAPEIAFGDEATNASDIHSWAATLVYAATGEPPFGRGPAMAVMDRVRRGEYRIDGVPDSLRDVLELALTPEPTKRPTATGLLTLLDADELATELIDAARTQDAMPTIVVPETRPFNDAPSPMPVPAPAPMAHAAPVAAATATPQEWAEPWAEPIDLSDVVEPLGGPAEGVTQMLPAAPGTQAGLLGEGVVEPPVRVKPPLAERSRRLLLLSALVAVVAVATVVAPWVTLTGVTLAVWLLRSLSMTKSASLQRRDLRGRKWYDSVWTLFSSPYHFLAAIPGALALVLWGSGIAALVALLCVAFGTTLASGLALTGVGACVGMWSGPGSERLRGPVTTITHPLSRRALPWLLAVAACAGVVWLLWLGGSAGGGVAPDSAPTTNWTPASTSPWLWWQNR